MRRFSSVLLVSLLLSACVSNRVPAPIVQRDLPGAKGSAPVANKAKSTPEADNNEAQYYTVAKGDGLYRIAFDHGLAYRDLAEWNNIANPDDIKVGQVLRLSPPEDNAAVVVRPLVDGTAVVAVPTPAKAPASTNKLAYPKALKLPFGSQAADSLANQAEGVAAKTSSVAAIVSKPATLPTALPVSKPEPNAEIKTTNKSNTNDNISDGNGNIWLAPTAGVLLGPYTPEAKGVDIAGKLGQSIVASETGKVVYAGSGLRGYGNLVIIKHDNAYLTAYAHNDKLLVKEGDSVKRGEKIAEMGSSDTDKVKLHFEIRKFGKPVDPTKFITADRP